MEATPFVFLKKYDQRLSELKDILNDKRKPLFGFSSKVKDLWVTYLEFYVEAVGWQALWKISRELCADLKLKFPTSVVVMVERVDYKELSANVTITNVESTIDIPQKFDEVPLVELFPIVEQDNEILIERTAEAIDHLRVFYCHLFYPWEAEDDETDWVIEHLEKRLSLHYDMISHNILHETADELTGLIAKGKQIYQEIKELEEVVIENDHSPTVGHNTLKLFELNHSLDHIKNQLSIFDDPLLRNLKMRENRAKIKRLRYDHNKFALAAMAESTIEELIKTFAELKLLVDPETFVRIVPSLQQALNELIPDEQILIGPGVHCLQNCRGLEECGIKLKGIMGDSKCIISEAEDNWALLDLRVRDIKFEGLTIQSDRVQYLIVVRQGVCRLNNVTLQGLRSAVGVIVHNGATLYAARCNFLSCIIGLVANPGSVVVLTECTFSKNKVGIEVQENSDVMIDGCVINDSEEYAVQLDQSSLPRKEGSSELLKVSGSINVTDLKLNHNFGDVLIEHVEPVKLEHMNRA